MSFQLSELKEAYIKLKTFVYYDSSDNLLRRKIVEFETNLTKQGTLLGRKEIPKPYKAHKEFFKKGTDIVEKKLELITKALNTHHEDSSFFNYFNEQIGVQAFPKTINEPISAKNFITNQKVRDEYHVDRVTCFIDAPIELHIIAVLWIMLYGVRIEKSLKSCCIGNRLLLNKENDGVIMGSGLFKPYHNQYKKWRDDSVDAAQNILKNGKNVLFLNLDIRDYFHSTRIRIEELLPKKTKANNTRNSLREIFIGIHVAYTKLVGQTYQAPYGFYDELKKDSNGNLLEVVLPIGLLSSYVLANDYLKDFDERIIHKIKPAYYGRYVDDILILIADPNTKYNETEQLDQLRFSFERYQAEINQNSSLDEKVSFKESELSSLEQFVLHNFNPLLQLVDDPIITQSKSSAPEKVFKLLGYPTLYCQSEKSIGYFFDCHESDLVIDKLKRELEYKSSEFRDFPDDNNDSDTFEDSAFYLSYDGTENKVRTLKDYKENRYGLTVYLANKIFSALRHEEEITTEEKDEVLKFFRGSSCLNFYRLWERIFTLFLVNNQPDAYVKFYLHCIEQIEKINGVVPLTKIQDSQVGFTLLEYLDASHELALSLNPRFIALAKNASRNFEFQIAKLQSESYLSWISFHPTMDTSHWVERFRMTNMIRHHHVVQPLLNYTVAGAENNLNLTSLSIDLTKYDLNDKLIKNSPRPVKFWECCLAIIFQSVGKFQRADGRIEDGYVLTKLLGIGGGHNINPTNDDFLTDDLFTGEEGEKISDEDSFYLDEAFHLFKRVNENHIPAYELDNDYKGKFYSHKISSVKYDHVKSTKVQEISIPFSERLSNPLIAFANTEVEGDNILKSLRGKPNLSFERYKKLAAILKKVRLEEANLLLFPECFIPINLLSSLVRHSEKNQVLTVTGLEHLTIDKTSFNFIATIMPLEVSGNTDAVVVLRLKNHYSHSEEALIEGNHCAVPKPIPYRYDIYNWRNLYFSTFYCFELANALHRSLFKSKIDLLIGIEWNRDTPYFSNIVEAGSRDLHTYVAQVNTSQFGDTRLTQPVETARKDILRLKGGTNDAILVSRIDIEKLREFQRQKFSITHVKSDFKPLPPDFSVEDVMLRIHNKPII